MNSTLPALFRLPALRLLVVTLWLCGLTGNLPAVELLVSFRQAVTATGAVDGDKTLYAADGRRLASGLRFGDLRAVCPSGRTLPFQIYTFHFEQPADTGRFRTALRGVEDVIHITPNHRYCIEQAPDDPLFDGQWGLAMIEAVTAWETARGEGVTLAVIDTGIDWSHPDLRDRIWFNQGEDDGNGTPFWYDPDQGWQLDPADQNGYDDDGNGLVDDTIGFDFTDAPAWPAPGDYLEADRDPWDEHRHGTIVASVAGAATGNGIGLAGAAPGVEIMPLRAGNSLGFLQEDDVAAALLYALFNGAGVVNMSFGDAAVAPVLHDVIQYAAAEGVVLVASAGNSGSSDPHYPSAWPEVTGVGAVTAAGYRWHLSNYGFGLDLVAPGDSILVALPGEEYGAYSGTSLAAPFVSAAAALLLEQNSALTPQLVRNLLRATATDVGAAGHDVEHGAGILNMAAAVANRGATLVDLQQPPPAARYQPARQPELAVIGTAAGNLFASSELSLGSGTDPDTWETLAVSSYQQVAETLAVVDLTGLADGIHTLKLEVHQLDGTSLPAISAFEIDRTPPVIERLTSLAAVEGSARGRFFQLDSDDPVMVELHHAPAGSDQFAVLTSPVSSRNHYLSLLQTQRSGWIDYRLLAISGTGDTTDTQLLSCYIPGEWYPRPLASRGCSLPYGQLLAETTDFNHNNRPEVWLAALEPDTHFPDLLQVWEYDPGTDDFAALPATYSSAYVKDAGDIDGDGGLELLSEIGGISYLFTQTDTLSPPNQLAWRSEQHWAANFIDPGAGASGYPNALLRIHSFDTPRHYFTALFSMISDTNSTVMVPLDTLYNPFYADGAPYATGVARGVEGDFDTDGNRELLLSDNEGHIFIYEFVSTQPELIWQHEEPELVGPGNLIAGGHFREGGQEDFIAVWRSPAASSEQELSGSRWVAMLFIADGDNSWTAADTLAVLGQFRGATQENGIAVGDPDGDGLDEIIVTLHPDLHLLEVSAGELTPIAWHDQTNLAGSLVHDFDGDGIGEWLGGAETGLYRLELADLDPQRTPPPVALAGFADSETSLLLSWQHGGEPDCFLLHRQYAQQETITVVSGQLREVQVAELLTDSTYSFTLRAVDPTYPQDTSQHSELINLAPNAAPTIVSLVQAAPHLLQLGFSESMSPCITEATRYLFTRGYVSRYPSSVIPWAGYTTALITVDLDAGDGVVTLQPGNLPDASGTPLDTAGSVLTCDWQTEAEEPFHLRQGRIVARDRFQLLFNRPVDASIENAANYHFQPDYYSVTGVTALDSLRCEFEIALETEVPLGAYGRPVLLQLTAITSLDSLALPPELSTLFLQQAASDLSDVFIYPNPWRRGEGAGDQPGVMIAGLPRVCEIYIYDISGRLLAELAETDGDGGCRWDGRGPDGLVPGGIYIVMLRQEDQIVRRKLAVID